jgi:hypothetical protein
VTEARVQYRATSPRCARDSSHNSGD